VRGAAPTSSSSLSLGQGEHLTRLGHALQRVHAAVDEREARATDEVAHCARDEYFTRRREGREARSDVHGDPSERAVRDLDLAGVDGRPSAQSQRLVLAIDVAREADSPCRCVEAGKESVAGAINLDPAMHRQPARNELVVAREQVAPARVPDARDELGGPDDVDSHQRGEKSLCSASASR
jgi:hypothetical protein